MAVRVDQTRRHRAPLQVDEPSIRSRKRLHLRIASDRDNPAATNGYRLRH
jgi:hypothetical protein